MALNEIFFVSLGFVGKLQQVETVTLKILSTRLKLKISQLCPREQMKIVFHQETGTGIHNILFHVNHQLYFISQLYVLFYGFLLQSAVISHIFSSLILFNAYNKAIMFFTFDYLSFGIAICISTLQLSLYSIQFLVKPVSRLLGNYSIWSNTGERVVYLDYFKPFMLIIKYC